jgi:acetyl-CoA acyltransferase
MSRVPMWSNVPDGADPFGPTLAARYPDGLVPQGISAELIAARWGLGRTDLDRFSLASHERAHAAASAGLFEREIAPIKAPGPDGAIVEVTADEGIRPDGTLEKLAGLRPAFEDPGFASRFPEIGWHITAANSSQISDGSAALLITSGERAAELGLRPQARLHSFAVVGDDPLMMLTAVIPATAKVLGRAGLTIDDIDLFEVNEAFSSVVLAWMAETGADPAKVNVHGGALAIGHPLGASGARLMTTLLGAMEERGARYGLQTMCEAGGLANATIIERL